MGNSGRVIEILLKMLTYHFYGMDVTNVFHFVPDAAVFLALSHRLRNIY
jgi:hypothetical protein